MDQSSCEPDDEKLRDKNLLGENDHLVISRSTSEFSPSSDSPHREIDFLEDEITLEQWEAEWGPDSTASSQDPESQPKAQPEKPQDSASPEDGESKGTRSSDATASGRLMGVVASATLLLVAWVIGPTLVERFYYARTKGEMLAKYDIAKTALEGAPLAQLSVASQWVSQKVKPTVVHIRTTSQSADGRLVPDWSSPLSEGQGSGVVVSTDGFILTNEHVIQNAEEIMVTLFDRRNYRAELVGVDSETDLAVLRIEAPNLIAADWGDSDALQVGSLVWALGSPFGLEQTTTQGIVSAKHRRQAERVSTKLHQDLLQSDVAINPGNSGGPLVNERGEVIGINTSIVGEAFCGISFAVPSSVAHEVFDRIRENGYVDRSFLGVMPSLIPGELVSQYQIPDGLGAFVQSVTRSTAAERAGIQEGDIILSWNGQVVENDIILFRLVGLTPPNSIALVELLRGGRKMKVEVKVDSRNQWVTP